MDCQFRKFWFAAGKGDATEKKSITGLLEGFGKEVQLWGFI